MVQTKFWLLPLAVGLILTGIQPDVTLIFLLSKPAIHKKWEIMTATHLEEHSLPLLLQTVTLSILTLASLRIARQKLKSKNRSYTP